MIIGLPDPESVRIEVTPDDIAAGKCGRSCECPIALAAQRALGRSVTVSGWAIGDRENHRVVIGLLPIEGSDFVFRFDNGEPVKPFSFDLDLL